MVLPLRSDFLALRKIVPWGSCAVDLIAHRYLLLILAGAVQAVKHQLFIPRPTGALNIVVEYKLVMSLRFDLRHQSPGQPLIDLENFKMLKPLLVQKFYKQGHLCLRELVPFQPLGELLTSGEPVQLCFPGKVC